jgi:iron complex transport system substrate-binding protein
MAARPAQLSAFAAALLTAAVAAQAPGRIVSLVPAVTEMLFAIGAGGQVVAVSSYDEFPPAVKALPRVGALLDPDIERTLGLTPDLVISYGSQTEFQEQLRRAGIRSFSYRHAGLSGIFLTLSELGSATGHTEEAAGLARALRQQLDAVRARTGGRRPLRTLLVFERDPGTLRGIYVSGGRGFLHEMLEIAGGANVFADVDRESLQPSQETLIARAPEVILEVRATAPIAGDIANAAERRAWSGLGSVPAVRNGRIHFLAGDYLVVPGPRIGSATEAFARALHPEAFR